MPAIWTTPKDWKYKDVWTATIANQQLRDNLLFLKMKPRHYVNPRTTDYAVAVTTSLGAIEDITLALTINTSVANEEVFIYASIPFSIPTTAQAIMFDVLMDNATYLSSGTSTPINSGLYRTYISNVGFMHQAVFRKRVVVPTAGTHTFVPRVKVGTSAVSMTVYSLSGTIEFGVQVE